MQVNTIWIFGDSFSCSFNHVDNLYWSQTYIDYLGHVPKSYPDLLSSQFEVINKSAVGIDNQSIFYHIVDNLNNIKPNDFVVVNWTEINRVRLSNSDASGFEILNPHNLETIDSGMSYDSMVELLINFSKNPHYTLLQTYNDVLNHIFKNKIYHWSWSPLNHIFNHIKGTSIFESTFGEVGDYHYDETSHKKIFKIILKIIEDLD